MADSDFELTLTKYRGNDADVVIPDGVASIGDFAFSGNDTMRSVRIPGSVRKIGRHAFNGCSALTSIELPEGVNIIDEHAFLQCDALCEVTLPDSLMNWDWSAFDDCNSLKLFHVPLGSQVRQIPDVLGVPAVDMDGAPLPPIPVEDEWDYEKRGGEICITGRNIGYAGTLFKRLGLVTTLYIPAMIEGLHVTSIGNYAFKNDERIDALYLPDGLSAIGREAFSGCKELSKVRVPKSLKTVAKDAFDSCCELDGDAFEPLYVEVYGGADAAPALKEKELCDETGNEYRIRFKVKVTDDGEDDDGGEDADDDTPAPHNGAKVIAFTPRGAAQSADEEDDTGLPRVGPNYPAFCKLSADILADAALDEASLRKLWVHCANDEKTSAVKLLTDRSEGRCGLRSAKEIVDKLFALFGSANE